MNYNFVLIVDTKIRQTHKHVWINTWVFCADFRLLYLFSSAVFLFSNLYLKYFTFLNFIGNGTTSRLKQLGMEFTVWVFKHVSALLLGFWFSS